MISYNRLRASGPGRNTGCNRIRCILSVLSYILVASNDSDWGMRVGDYSSPKHALVLSPKPSEYRQYLFCTVCVFVCPKGNLGTIDIEVYVRFVDKSLTM